MYRIQAGPVIPWFFRHLGFSTREAAVGGRRVIDVALAPEAVSLDALVVTALGIERRRALGYAVQEVDGRELEKAKEPNVLGSLTGKVAGLTVYNQTGLFETPEIRLQGRRPLIVVDGVPHETDFWDISPDDVGKRQRAQGDRGFGTVRLPWQDGAVLITTKRGNRNRPGLAVAYNSSNLFQNGFVAIPEVQTLYGTGYGGRYAYRDGKGGGVFDGAGWIWGPRLDQTGPDGSCMKVAQYDSPVDPATGAYTPTCWTSRGRNNLENFLHTGLITDHNLSVTSTTESGSFRASLSHLYQRGQVPNTRLNKTTFALSGVQNLGDRFRADATWTYNRQYTPNYPRTGYGPQNYVYNLLLWTGVDVDVRDLRNYWQQGREGIQQRHYNYAWYNNPYFLAYENLQGYYKDTNYGRVALDYDLSDALKLTVRSGANLYSLTEDLKVPLSLINYEDATNGNYVLEDAKNFDLDTDVFLGYDQPLSTDWELKATVGGNNRWYRYTHQWTRTAGLNVPGLYNLGNSATDLRATNRLERKRTTALFGTFDVGFRDAVFLGVTARNDWSSALPEQNNSYFYPSVSLAAVVSDLLPVPATVRYLKLRASWARVANDLELYSTTPVYNSGVNWNGTPSVVFPSAQLNPDIQPEQSTTWEFGADARFFGDRLGVDVTHYNSVDENDIIYLPVSEASGFGSRLLNANKYRRRGWEVALNATPLKRGESVAWDLGLNWSRNRRYLLELAPGLDNLNGVRPGERMDLFRGWLFNRAPDGQIIYARGLPTYQPAIGKIGYADPDWVAGLNSRLRAGNFALDLQFDGRYKGLIYSQTHRKMWWGGTHPGTVTSFRDDENAGKATYVGEGVVVVSGGVKRDKDGNIIEDTRVFAPNTTPVFWSTWVNSYYHNTSDEPNVFDASFVKFREFGLTYRLPARWSRRFAADAASVSLVGRNLWMWSEVDFIDPETASPDSRYREDLQTPSARNVGFNVNLTF